MTQYRPARWNIVRRAWAIAAAMALAAGTAAQEKPEYLKYRQATQEAFAQQAVPPVEVGGSTVSGRAIEAGLRVQPWVTANSLDFVLAAPAGEVTSATVLVEEIFSASEVDAPTLADWGTTAGLDFQRELSVSVKHLGWVRGNRLLKVQMPSVVPGSFGRRLKSGRLQIALEEPIATAEAADEARTGDNPFNLMLQKLVANPTDVERFDVALKAAPEPGPESPVPLGGYNDAVARFETAEEGFVKFSGADLAACGVDLANVQATSVSVWSDGEPQPVHSSASFEGQPRPVRSDDEFIVYARDNDSTYTARRVYWVRTGVDQLPMDAVIDAATNREKADPGAHFTATQVVEQDVPPVLTKNDQFLTILGYRWVWWTWTASGNGSAVPNARSYSTSGSLEFDLDGLSLESENAELGLSFYAHHWTENSEPVPFRVELNGQQVGRIAISEPDALEHTINVSSSVLRAMDNRMVITPETTATRSLPELCFDKLTIDYPRSYAMTSSSLEFYPPADAGGPIALRLNNETTTSLLVADISEATPKIIASKSGTRNGIRFVDTDGPRTRKYLAVTREGIRQAKLEKVVATRELRSADNRADLVVIAWPDFIEDLKPWVENKRSKGHAVQVVSVFDIYDQFGYGHESPYAIREFIRFVSIHWQGSEKGPAASTILLVGDSTSAYRNEFRNDVINYVPTMRLTEGSDPFASDQWFVSIFGDDVMADAMIGRFSVNSREDLRSVISKQLDYETRSAAGPWKNTLGFIADHSEFEDSLDRVMRGAVPPRFFRESIRMADLPWIDNYYFPKEIADARQAKVSPTATRRIRDMFNKGVAVVTYFGHGSPNIWSNERMWFGGDSPNSDNLLLTNRDRLPIVINMTCNSGAIDYPQPRWNICISEDFMRVKNGGAVACFVPSGPGLTVQHEHLMMEVGRCLFGPEPEPIGQSMQLALWRYLAEGNPPELAEMYILLGDPLLVPHIARPMDTQAAGATPTVSWPGTIALPADVAAQHRGGAFQFTTYDDSVEPGPVQTFTSSTLALPANSPNEDEARVLALSTTSYSGTTGTRSTVAPVANLGAVELVQWRRVDKATDGGSTATLELRLRNSAPVPVLGMLVEVQSRGSKLVESSWFDLGPLEERFVKIDVPSTAGITPIDLVVTDNRNRRSLDSDSPIAIVGLRSDDEQDTIPPALIDPRTVTVTYRTSGDKIVATVSCRIYVTAIEPLSNLRVGLENPEGVVAQDSVVTVPPVGPGEGARVSLATAIPIDMSSGDYKVRFDPSGFYPEFARHPAHNVVIGHSQFADPLLVSVSPSEISPTDGETVFFDVAVANAGNAPVDGLKTEGYLVEPGGKLQRLESKVSGMHSLLKLEPGTTKTIRLRWDPFENAGENQLQFKVTSIYEMPDANPENNKKSLTLDVRTKARIDIVKVGVLPLTAADKAARQVRFVARVHNEGETDATGMRVMFHSNEPRTPENLLGEADLDSLKAGETKDVTFTYQLKAGEEHKPIRVSCEVLYKGSRQRVSVE